jgi:hypothetical protein
VKLVAVLFLFSGMAWAQQGCVQLNPSSTLTGQSSLACQITQAPPPPPTPLSIPTQACNNGTAGVAYTCTIFATGGTTPYTWTLASGSLGGATLSTVANQANITNPNPTAGTSTFSLQVTDALSATATIPLSILITPAGQCGWPIYKCGRDDGIRRTYPGPALDVPPDAGPNHCVAGDTGDPTNPVGMIACGNSIGINTKIVEPFYNNAQLVRITDATDTPKCATNVQGNVQVGPGGAAEHNVFSTDSNYVTLSCTGWYSIKWFDPVNMQVRTNVESGGWVITQTNAIWKTSGAMRFSYVSPNIVYVFTAPFVDSYTLTNGRVTTTASTRIADFSLAIPCWNAASSGNIGGSTGTCPDWHSGTYQPGANIYPQTGNSATKHSFQLVNTGTCTTGLTQPDWTQIVPAANASFSQVVIQDGSCTWGDMWIPPQLGGRYNWNAGNNVDYTDTKYSGTFNNHGGQDAAGGCYAVWYDKTTNTYSNLNSCTGNVYNTTCTGSTAYNCAGGTLTQTFLGNVFVLNQFVAPLNGVSMHENFGSKGGHWSYISFGGNGNLGCALVHLDGTCYWASYDTNVWMWMSGTTKLYDAYTQLKAKRIGHQVPGIDTHISRSLNNYDFNQYRALNIQQLADTGVTPPISEYFDVRGFDCQPIACYGPLGTNPTLTIRYVGFDDHNSWVSAQPGDHTPSCTQPYPVGGYGTRVDNTTPPNDLSRNDSWSMPPAFAWFGEVVCYATDGTNRVTRQAYTYNTMVSTAFNVWASIGSLSSDGQFWAFNSNWNCTLGAYDGSPVPLCGMPFYGNYNYQVGEYVGPGIDAAGSYQAQLFKVTTAGLSAPAPPGQGVPANPKWCVTVGCTVQNGTVTFTNVGKANGKYDVFIVKLQ